MVDEGIEINQTLVVGLEHRSQIRDFIFWYFLFSHYCVNAVERDVIFVVGILVEYTEAVFACYFGVLVELEFKQALEGAEVKSELSFFRALLGSKCISEEVYLLLIRIELNHFEHVFQPIIIDL